MIYPMQTAAPGAGDLICHTVKHFLGRDEQLEWEQVPVGAPARVFGAPPLRFGGCPTTSEHSDRRWWASPWRNYVERAHNDGYEPKYLFLSHMVGPQIGARWEQAANGRWLGDVFGFRLVCGSQNQDLFVISAFFSRTFRHDHHPRAALRAFREFLDSPHCPASLRSRVYDPGSEP